MNALLFDHSVGNTIDDDQGQRERIISARTVMIIRSFAPSLFNHRQQVVELTDAGVDGNEARMRPFFQTNSFKLFEPDAIEHQMISSEQLPPPRRFMCSYPRSSKL